MTAIFTGALHVTIFAMFLKKKRLLLLLKHKQAYIHTKCLKQLFCNHYNYCKKKK